VQRAGGGAVRIEGEGGRVRDKIGMSRGEWKARPVGGRTRGGKGRTRGGRFTRADESRNGFLSPLHLGVEIIRLVRFVLKIRVGDVEWVLSLIYISYSELVEKD
jgi:hypothetical protein